MSSLSSSAPTLSVPRIHRHSRALVAIVVALLFAGGGVMIHAESQPLVLAVIAAFILAFGLADRTQIGREIAATCSDHGGFANGVALLCALILIVLFRADHYALLMLATVAIFSTACIALNLQLAFAGIANFAGAAFFVIGSYTAAVLSAYTPVPRALAPLIAAAVTGAVGIVLLLPVLRTRGHYAALVTIAFGVLLRTWLEVNDAFGGPQGMKIGSFSIFGLDFARVNHVGPVSVSFYLPYAALAVIMFGLVFILVQRLEKLVGRHRLRCGS